MSTLRYILASTALTGLGLLGSAVPAQGIGGGIEVVYEGATIADHIGAVVPTDLTFTDSRGYPLGLRQFFPGDRPVLLNLGYFGCPWCRL